MGTMSASDAAPLPRLGEVFFDVRGNSRSMRLSWYADTGVAVLSIWQGGMCTGTFRLAIADLPRMVETLQRGPGAQQPGWDGETPGQAFAGPPGDATAQGHAMGPMSGQMMQPGPADFPGGHPDYLAESPGPRTGVSEYAAAPAGYPGEPQPPQPQDRRRGAPDYLADPLEALGQLGVPEAAGPPSAPYQTSAREYPAEQPPAGPTRPADYLTGPPPGERPRPPADYLTGPPPDTRPAPGEYLTGPPPESPARPADYLPGPPSGERPRPPADYLTGPPPDQRARPADYLTGPMPDARPQPPDYLPAPPEQQTPPVGFGLSVHSARSADRIPHGPAWRTELSGCRRWRGLSAVHRSASALSRRAGKRSLPGRYRLDGLSRSATCIELPAQKFCTEIRVQIGTAPGTQISGP
jgi:hypothetical protein